jgi:hypothetical protein
MVAKMPDMAKVTPRDIRDGSRIGRRPHGHRGGQRGALRDGIEYNPDMVELSKRNAERRA